MQGILSKLVDNPILENVSKRLSLRDLLNLKQINKKFDSSFSIVDLNGELHFFDALTETNIRQYRRLREELSLFFLEAFREKQMDAILTLLDNPDLNINVRGLFGNTALIIASQTDQIELVRLLLQNPYIKINTGNNSGDTALMVASKYGHLEVVRLLLSRPEIQVNIRNNEGNTALILASFEDHLEIVKLLLSRSDIDVNAENKYGYTAIEPNNQSQEIIQMLRQDPRVIRKYGLYHGLL